MSNKSVNLLKVIAMMMVFILHSSIYCAGVGFTYTDKIWFLQTPAWAAVWIFIFVSGFLNGKGFIVDYEKNNKFSFKYTLNYYLKRILKVYIPYVLFGTFAVILLDKGYLEANPKFFVQLLTATFKNEPGSVTVGVLWYVSTVLWLYLLTPLIMFVLSFINKKRNNIVVIIEIIIALSIGCVWRLHMKSIGAPWSSKVYVPFYANLDIFVCGILINYLDAKKIINKWTQIATTLLLFGTLIFNTRIYYLSNTSLKWLEFYWYIMPSIYIVVLGIYLITHVDKVKWNCNVLGKIIDFFANISFFFYMSHCIFLNAFCTQFINIKRPKLFYLVLMLVSFIATTIFSVLLNKALNFSVKKKVDEQ